MPDVDEAEPRRTTQRGDDRVCQPPYRQACAADSA